MNIQNLQKPGIGLKPIYRPIAGNDLSYKSCTCCHTAYSIGSGDDNGLCETDVPSDSLHERHGAMHGMVFPPQQSCLCICPIFSAVFNLRCFLLAWHKLASYPVFPRTQKRLGTRLGTSPIPKPFKFANCDCTLTLVV